MTNELVCDTISTSQETYHLPRQHDSYWIGCGRAPRGVGDDSIESFLSDWHGHR
jgi:hypothetical protein